MNVAIEGIRPVLPEDFFSSLVKDANDERDDDIAMIVSENQTNADIHFNALKGDGGQEPNTIESINFEPDYSDSYYAVVPSIGAWTYYCRWIANSTLVPAKTTLPMARIKFGMMTVIKNRLRWKVKHGRSVQLLQ